MPATCPIQPGRARSGPPAAGPDTSILRAAVEDGYLIRNPAARTAPPRPRQSALRPLTVEQAQALLDAIPDRYRVAVLLGAGCGLRIGEVLGLTGDAIDLDGRELTVAWQLQALPGQPPTLRPPTAASGPFRCPTPPQQPSRTTCTAGRSPAGDRRC